MRGVIRSEQAHVAVAILAPGGTIGRHAAAVPQLFVVVEGSGWVAGDDAERVEVRRGRRRALGRRRGARGRHRRRAGRARGREQRAHVIDLFPVSARIEDGELALGGVTTSALAEEFGTPLVVYCEKTLRTQAQAYRAAAPGALIAYGTKAFANVALLRVLAEEGLGADVSTLGELAFARAAGIPDERLVLHGNNKSDDELAAARGHARRPRRARRARAGTRGRGGAAARAGHARGRGGDARRDPDRARGLEVRPHPRPGARADRARSGDPRRAPPRRLPAPEPDRGSRGGRGARGLRRVLRRLAAPCPRPGRRAGRPLPARGAGAERRGVRRGPALRLDARAARAARARAGALARRPRRRDALPGRLGQGGGRRRQVRRGGRRHVGQPPPSALRRLADCARRGPRRLRRRTAPTP